MDEDNKIANNAEYKTEEELNQIEGKDGEPLDPIEQNQVAKGQEDLEMNQDENASDELAGAIAGNDDNAQDKALEEENN